MDETKEDQELAQVIEEIRVTVIADLLAIIRALREIRKKLSQECALELLVKDDYSKEKYEQGFEEALKMIWQILRALEKPKPKQERPALPQKPPEINLWA